MERKKAKNNMVHKGYSKFKIALKILSTAVEVATRILTQGGATVQGSLSFTHKVLLVAIFVFQLRPSEPCRKYPGSVTQQIKCRRGIRGKIWEGGSAKFFILPP